MERTSNFAGALKFTPITTDLIMNLERLDKSGKLGDHNLLFEVWDDRGESSAGFPGRESTGMIDNNNSAGVDI